MTPRREGFKCFVLDCKKEVLESVPIQKEKVQGKNVAFWFVVIVYCFNQDICLGFNRTGFRVTR